MRRTLTVAAATAALLLPAGPLPVAEAGSAMPPPGKWSAREAENFWTADRMAAAAPMTLASAAPATDPGTGQDFDGIPVVGRMFVMKGGGAYFCTASVVASPGRNLVLSAAHCLLGTDARQVAFVPLYTADNPQPYGMFPVQRAADGKSKVWIDPRYKSLGADKGATLDVAFAQVGPDADGFPVEDVVGGNRLVTGAGYEHANVSLIGYPASAARPRLCVNGTTKFTSKDAGIPGSFLRIDCTGYPGGTSGGPFLKNYDKVTETGDVVGVIGGWKTGGDTADTSYSSYFGPDVRKLYEQAVAGAKAA
ncbi:serine protease [Streptomyces sp. KS 21]|uniref:S1 family peptidase n=1 Tax=Streptomyces sp. KS 21 TaxID=2485150 RepID=UPI0010631941|nr:serine protease [Streptomyces sp. KS 21]TDU74399.1 V8-like Glu-specific endopeptidase [Streptomyces sp. KS 21]